MYILEYIVKSATSQDAFTMVVSHNKEKITKFVESLPNSSSFEKYSDDLYMKKSIDYNADVEFGDAIIEVMYVIREIQSLD